MSTQIELTSQQLEQIKTQLSFYLSDSNFPRDQFLLDEAKKNEEGWINISEFAKFNKIKATTSDVGVISKCFENCDDVVLSEDRLRVKRKNPAPSIDVIDKRTILVSYKKIVDRAKIEQIFSKFGKILSVWNLKSKKGVRHNEIEYENEDIAKATVAQESYVYQDGDEEITFELKLKYFLFCILFIST